ncbi:MAG: greA [Clostridia bacterium]|jgi:transcription elongation factor GreA|nr:greA [Clostridia bacterium]
MASKKVLLTYEGIKTLEAELENLKIVRRIDVAEKLKEARAQGDLSENAEYDAAKEEQAEIEVRIAELENMLKNAVVIDSEDTKIDVVKPGYRVKLYDYAFEEEVEYLIVGSTEADPANGKISNESPLGEAILNHKVGTEVQVETAYGVDKYKILEIKN